MRETVRLLGRVVDSLRCSLPQLVGFELLVSLIAWAVMIPLSTWLSTRLIASTGHVAVANKEIVSFVLGPIGILTLLVLLITELAGRLSRLAGPMLIDASVEAGRGLRAFDALVRVARLLPRLLWLGLLMVGRFLLIAGPIAAIAGFVASRLLSERDIYYYLTIRPTEFWIATTIVGLAGVVTLLVGVVMLARWILGIPVLLFEGSRGSAALERSRELSRGSFWRLSALLVAWGVLFALLASVASLVGGQLGELAVRALGDSLKALVPTLGLILAAYLAGLFVLDVVSSLSLALIISHLYIDRVAADSSAALPKAAVTKLAGRAERKASGVPRWVRWVAVVGVLGFGVSLTATLAESLELRDEVEITAHRGSSLRAPENTLAAIELAIAEGADYAEIDVQETADGVVVVLHDRDLKRVTGVTRNIWDVTYAELRELDAGSWFSDEFSDQRVPTLQEAIDTARGRVKLNIELKYNGHDEALAARTAELIRDNGFEDQVILTSLEYAGLAEVGRLGPEIPLGFIVARSVGDPWRLDVQFLSVQTALITAGTAPLAHRNGKQVHVWSVNDPNEMSRLIDLGVDNIITDDPLLARQVLKSRAELGDVERLILFIRNRLAG
jgi:glycerophosphoryl diester phosphodiesterase